MPAKRIRKYTIAYTSAAGGYYHARMALKLLLLSISYYYFEIILHNMELLQLRHVIEMIDALACGFENINYYNGRRLKYPSGGGDRLVW